MERLKIGATDEPTDTQWENIIHHCRMLESKNKIKGFSDGIILMTVKYSNLCPVVKNWTKLLANVTLRFLSWNMANTLIFFFWKMWVAFALQKLLTFLQKKDINVFENTLATTVNEFCH